VGIINQLQSGGFRFNKRLGQNFIADEGFLESIVSELKISRGDCVVEVGAGAGTLTQVLAQTGANVVAYEIDRRLETILKEKLIGFSNVELLFKDAMSADISLEEYTIAANIPYYITTPLIMKFLKDQRCVRICVLVQADVAKRITAKPGTKEFGALSVACQVQADCKILRLVPRGLFIPRPQVDSAFVVLTKRQGSDSWSQNNDTLEKLLKGLFAARRKTVLNGLSQTFGFEKTVAREILDKAGIPETARPEQLSVDKFVKLVSELVPFLT